MQRLIIAVIFAMASVGSADAQSGGVAPLTEQQMQAANAAARRAADAADKVNPTLASPGWRAEQRGAFTEAARLYRKPCNDARDAVSCQNLAFLYERGLGVPKDFGQAATLYERTLKIDPANLFARARLAVVRPPPEPGMPKIAGASGRVPAGDNVITRPPAFDEKAAKLDSNLRLGYFLYLQNDIVLAVRYFDKACQSRNALGCSNSGSLALETNYGGYTATNKDIVERYFKRACSMGYQPACNPPLKITKPAGIGQIANPHAADFEIPALFRGRYAKRGGNCVAPYKAIIGKYSVFRQDRLTGSDPRVRLQGGVLEASAGFSDEITGRSGSITTSYRISPDGQRLVAQQGTLPPIELQKCSR